MSTKVRIFNEGPHHIVVGTPTERGFVSSGDAMTMQVGDKHPIVITEYESDLNEVSALVLPEGFRQ